MGGHCLREELQLLRNPYFLLATMGMVAITFAIGGLSEWYPTFLVRYAHMEESSSGLVLSGSSVLSGIGGTVLGSKVADYVAQNIGPGAFFLVPAAFMVPGAILIALAANLKSKAFLATPPNLSRHLLPTFGLGHFGLPCTETVEKADP